MEYAIIKMMHMGTYKDLIVFKKAYSLAMDILVISRFFRQTKIFFDRSNKKKLKISLR